MNRNTLLLLGAFALGCAAGLHMDTRAQAQGFPTPGAAQRWQQFCGEYATTEELNTDLRKLGDERWELVGTSYGGYRIYACFKRPGV